MNQYSSRINRVRRLTMLYKNDFIIQYFNNKPFFVNRNAFTVTLNNNLTKRKTFNKYSIAYALKPLTYFSSLFALNCFTYSKNGIKKLNVYNKFYCALVILLFVPFSTFVRSINFRQVGTDLPFDLITKYFIISQCLENIYDLFSTSFGNSHYYIKLIETIDSIDDHFQITKTLFIKRRIFSIVLTLIPIFLISFTFAFFKFELLSIVNDITLVIILLQGINCIFFATIIYICLLNFNIILRKKLRDISSSKKLIFKDDSLAYFINVSC